jgi:FkbM family methyltransferase
MNRRTLFSKLRDGISSSFIVGMAGGACAGAVGTAAALHDPGTSQAKTSWSEQGEDLIVESICGYLRITNPTYLDIGAAHPIVNNNTYLFYRKGSRGVLVEPNPSLYETLRTTRPGDTVLNVGIGFDDRTQADYYMVSGSLMNTFSKQEIEAIAAKLGHRNFIEKVITMPLVNINRVIAEHFPKAPDFISIDTEGLDLDILRSLDFDRYRPPVLCAETIVAGTTNQETKVLDLMHAKGYTVRGETFLNTIFIDNRVLGR